MPSLWGATEALVIIAALTAISLAGTALLDLLGSQVSWRRKAIWTVLIVGLPLVGAVLYYRRAPPERSNATGLRRGAGACPPESPNATSQPEARPPDAARIP